MRAINAALMLLGDATLSGGGKKHAEERDDDGGSGGGGRGGDTSEVHANARSWLGTYNITGDQIGHVFQLDGADAEVIAGDVPGKSLKEKTIQAYVITGIGHFLKTGERTFTDKAARAVCKHMGCLNQGNHSNYLGSRGNLFGGSKKSGWKLTGPGLRKGADLVQDIAGQR